MATKKTYNELANEVNSLMSTLTSDHDKALVKKLVLREADVFARDNVRFDQSRFLVACGVA